MDEAKLKLIHTSTFNVASCSDIRLLRAFRARIYPLLAKGASWSEAEAALFPVDGHIQANQVVAG